MRAPRFWQRESVSPLPGLLQPAAAIVSAAGALRQRFATPYRCRLPVICVGNLVAGGAGKTPVALALAGMLQDTGRRPAFLTRGYGGRLPGPLRVSAEHDFRGVGDEALLLAQRAPTWVARDRSQGAQAIEAAGDADVLVMDDGFQNPGLHKDLAILVVDAGYGFGNGHVMPAGPLREPAARGLARADAVVLVGAGPTPTGCTGALRGRLQPVDGELSGRRVFAFAGIGRPSKFFDSLREIGAEIVGSRSFPDHHPFTPAELRLIEREAGQLNALPVTTEKDRVRIRGEAPAGLAVLQVRFVLDDATARGALLAALASSKPL